MEKAQIQSDQPDKFFNQRLLELQKEAQKLASSVNQLSWIRVACFLALLSAVSYFANARDFESLLFSIVIIIPFFGFIVKKHNKAKFNLLQSQHLIQINQDELKRCKGELSSLYGGVEFLDSDHNYAPDLDIFGSNSLFQLLSRSQLAGTIAVLKNWMLSSSSKEEIEERQIAIKELSQDTLWRQKLTAYGHHGNQSDQKYANVVESLVQWLDDNLKIIDKPIWGLAQYLIPVASAIILFGMAFLGWSYQWIYIPVLINMILLGIIFKPLMEITKEFGGISDFMKGYENVILEIENHSFQSSLLLNLSGNLKSERGAASSAIRSLRRVLHFLLNRANFLYQPINLLFLLDVIWLRMALNWKKKHVSHVNDWFSSVHEIDAISDLSSFAFANPDFNYSELQTEKHILKTESLGHPLIKPNQRVYNDFELSKEGSLGLITGSNMSGKSTFLRTIGVNLVLAQMGAPVCAKSFQFSLTQIYTSMRTQDNLEENVSSFYAELRRLKKLLDSINDENPVFYMLDEILKGTNSEDRHKGAISLIKQLTHQNCRGLISTHDIQLADLSKDHSHIQNFSFNSTIVEDEIIFNYKIDHAPCHSFNASKLMEKMGIIK